MAISFACPSCEHRLKVKDELAGRKVKCPSCGNGVAVPSEEEETPAAAKTQKAREDSSEEERPRKKKKKKKSNTGLVIGLVAGAVVLVALIVVLVIVFSRPKDQPNKEPAGKDIAQNPPPKQDLGQQPQGGNPQPHPEQRVAGLANRGEDTAVMNDLNQIKIAYQDYLITHPRGPRNAKEFADSIRRGAPGIAKRIDDQIYYVFPGKHQGPTSVIAYDVPGNTAGMHIVLTGDLTVQAMPQAQLQQYIKQQTKQ